jgi:hypothetical protein
MKGYTMRRSDLRQIIKTLILESKENNVVAVLNNAYEASKDNAGKLSTEQEDIVYDIFRDVVETVIDEDITQEHAKEWAGESDRDEYISDLLRDAFSERFEKDVLKKHAKDITDGVYNYFQELSQESPLLDTIINESIEDVTDQFTDILED